ncbi:hypothetical protein WT55_27010 [Burkholderia pseudomultivorans]|uniref:Uncharacterized protein n=1 Tax=Burkholderia cenocepacia TaxID=95486 RepID=A0AAN0RZA5_9BURK|nr:hypothetical protein DM39_5576 [Burkholderia cenocepacia]EGD00891.1 amidohydrolase 2 [Burkholderia sp. TJI49]KVG65393.1 hypothetical protein WS80_13975 [Burkholderia pseudomultivorans]KWF03282.1 hypothetical protein WT55_27010 [Burkholderia pseudomultivorans]
MLVFERQLPDRGDFCVRHDAHALVLDHPGKPAPAEFEHARWRALASRHVNTTDKMPADDWPDSKARPQ